MSDGDSAAVAVNNEVFDMDTFLSHILSFCKASKYKYDTVGDCDTVKFEIDNGSFFTKLGPSFSAISVTSVDILHIDDPHGRVFVEVAGFSVELGMNEVKKIRFPEGRLVDRRHPINSCIYFQMARLASPAMVVV